MSSIKFDHLPWSDPPGVLSLLPPKGGIGSVNLPVRTHMRVEDPVLAGACPAIALATADGVGAWGAKPPGYPIG